MWMLDILKARRIDAPKATKKEAGGAQDNAVMDSWY